MAHDYIQIEGVNYRCEINMATVEDWENLSGLKLGQFEIEAAQSVNTGGVATRAVLLWLFCAIREGESIEGRQFTTDFNSFKKLVRPALMSLFIPIFLKQYMGNVSQTKQPVSETELKKKNQVKLSVLLSFVKSQLGSWVLGLTIFAIVVLVYYLMR